MMMTMIIGKLILGCAVISLFSFLINNGIKKEIKKHKGLFI